MVDGNGLGSETKVLKFDRNFERRAYRRPAAVSQLGERRDRHRIGHPNPDVFHSASAPVIPRFLPVTVGLLVACALLPGGVWAQKTLQLGESLPSTGMALQRGDGTTVAPRTLGGEEGTVILFWSNQCPWVDRYQGRVDSLAAAFRERGVEFVLVNANDPTDHPAESLDAGATSSSGLPYLRDPNAQLARSLGATRTPHAFVFDERWTLRYAGAIDDSPSLPGQVEQAYLRDALRALVSGSAVSTEPHPAFGCTVKFPE